jgi:hypothetical protein
MRLCTVQFITWWMMAASASPVGIQAADREPLKADLQASASNRWLNKKVLESRLLDEMESLDQWSPFTNGPWVAVVVPDGDLSQRKEIIGSAWE